MTLRTLTTSVVTAVSIVAPVASQEPPAAQTDRRRAIAHVLETLDRVRAFHQTAISPDGHRVAWVEDVSLADSTTAVFVRDVGTSGSPERVTAAPDGKTHKQDGVAWWPGGYTLALRPHPGPLSQRRGDYVDLAPGAVR